MSKLRLPKKTISNHPGVALFQAIADLKKCMKDKRYKIEMEDYFHLARPKNKTHKCIICLAGSVMSKTLGCRINRTIGPHYYPGRTEKKLEGLDRARQYEWHGFFISFGMSWLWADTISTKLIQYIHTERKFSGYTTFKNDRKAFIQNMEIVAKWLIDNVQSIKNGQVIWRNV